jgi:hypothetical protein
MGKKRTAAILRSTGTSFTIKERDVRHIQGLKNLLIFKMAATALLWCLPLLLFPATLFAQLGFPAPEPLLFARLLGAAYLTMLVGYWLAVQQLNKGSVPYTVIVTGIVNNGLAALLLLYFGFDGAWSHWGSAAQVFMWLSAFGATGIAGCLGYFARRV